MYSCNYKFGAYKLPEIDDKELVKIIYRRYEILKELFPDREYTLTELANRVGIDSGNLSRYITSLERNKLVRSEEKERERGRPFRYVKLTDGVKKIIASFIEATQQKPEKKTEMEQWKIDMYINMMKDSELSDELRYSVANRFFGLFGPSENFASLVRLKRVQELFEETIANPPIDNKVGERLRATVRSSMARLVHDEKTRRWVLEKLYPHLIKHVEDSEDQTIWKWALSMIGDIARLADDPKIRNSMIDKIFAIYFNEDIALDIKREEIARNELAWLASDSKKLLFERIVTKAKSANPIVRERAEALLKELI